MARPASVPTASGAQACDTLWRRLTSALWERRRVILLERDLAEPIDTHVAELPVRFAWAGAQDLARLVGPPLNFREDTLRAAREWLDEGDQCLIGYVDAAPATYRWVTFRVRRLPGRRLPLGPGHAYFYKSFTVAPLRRRGLNQAALSVALARCRDSGIARVFSDVDEANAGSLRSLRNAGFRDFGAFTILRVRRWRRAFVPRRVSRRIGAGAHS